MADVADMTDAKIEADAPSDKAMREINERLRALLDEAPSDASVEMKMRRTRKGYRGILKIYSSQRRFVGGWRASRFSEVVDRVFREVRTQIKQWKRDRFARLGIDE